jgi:hypothetical protein
MDHSLVAVRAKNKMANVGSSRHCLCDLGLSLPPERQYAKGLCTMCQSRGIRQQNPPDLENLFLHRLMRYCTDCSFEMADF